eukprot:GILK01022359.1.p1 GENE.GILK01022359.1~~GILK01022359.1.p1  ORF type:complete len:151 (+),score=17.22 GILK01022359.1:28-453(+)
MASTTASGALPPTSELAAMGSTSAKAMAATHHEKASLAFLAIRNLCFYHSIKIQICQDTRLMTLFKDALVAAAQMGTFKAGAQLSLTSSVIVSSPVIRSVTAAGGASPSALSAPALEVFRRQQLALSALSALVFNNQRAKS